MTPSVSFDDFAWYICSGRVARTPERLQALLELMRIIHTRVRYLDDEFPTFLERVIAGHRQTRPFEDSLPSFEVRRRFCDGKNMNSPELFWGLPDTLSAAPPQLRAKLIMCEGDEQRNLMRQMTEHAASRALDRFLMAFLATFLDRVAACDGGGGSYWDAFDDPPYCFYEGLVAGLAAIENPQTQSPESERTERLARAALR